MKINTQYLKTTKTARFITYGCPPGEAKYLWFVLHGSNMTCEQMVYKFTEFDESKHCIVAPEALNRFYANGFSGEVVAAWMTKRDRLKEIEDFSAYLSKLFHSFADVVPRDCKKIVLGFSQGGTTMYRWLHHSPIDLHYIIPYSCWIPEDIDLKESKTPFPNIPTFYTYGLQDPHLKDEVITQLKSVVEKNELVLQYLPYDGDHRVSRQQLKRIFEQEIEN